jgi:hypothetical protein
MLSSEWRLADYKNLVWGCVPCAAWGKEMSRLFAFMHSLNFAHEIGLADVLVFDNKSLKDVNLLFCIANNIWLFFSQSKNDAAITA